MLCYVAPPATPGCAVVRYARGRIPPARGPRGSRRIPLGLGGPFKSDLGAAFGLAALGHNNDFGRAFGINLASGSAWLAPTTPSLASAPGAAAGDPEADAADSLPPTINHVPSHGCCISSSRPLSMWQQPLPNTGVRNGALGMGCKQPSNHILWMGHSERPGHNHFVGGNGEVQPSVCE